MLKRKRRSFALRGRKILDYLNVALNDLALLTYVFNYRANMDYFSEQKLKMKVFCAFIKEKINEKFGTDVNVFISSK